MRSRRCSAPTWTSSASNPPPWRSPPPPWRSPCEVGRELALAPELAAAAMIGAPRLAVVRIAVVQLELGEALGAVVDATGSRWWRAGYVFPSLARDGKTVQAVAEVKERRAPRR